MIPVTKPFLPPKKEFEDKIATIWETQWLTNSGPLNNELENRLENYLDVKNLLFVGNGTIALQMAIKSLQLSGEVITTPFSFVATTSSIVWENCTPIYVDIDPHSLNIDPSKIEAAITDKTSAILATHVYGNPCDVMKIEEIAKKYNLKVIYDGAHAFGVKLHGKSIFEYGDISICSTHATKLYHTTEGGFIVAKSKELYQKLKSMRNFGFKSTTSFSLLGLNAKNSEFHAAMGLVNLEYIDLIIRKRRQLSNLYNSLLDNLLVRPLWHKEASVINSYQPVIFESEEILLLCKEALEKKGIIARRYFYPSLSQSLPYVNPTDLPVADEISNKVLCLPLYYDLKTIEVELICETLINQLEIALA